MPTSMESRMATVEANMSNIASSVGDIKSFLLERARVNGEQYTTIMSTLAVLESKQDDMHTYQATCDEERKDITARVGSVESAQDHATKTSASVATYISIAIGGVTALIEYLRH